MNPAPSSSYIISGINVQFPLERAYPSQIALMNRIIRAIENEDHALLESPTGTGKTLALLCASLAWVTQRTKEYEKELNAWNKEKEDRLNAKLSAVVESQHAEKWETELRLWTKINEERSKVKVVTDKGYEHKENHEMEQWMKEYQVRYGNYYERELRLWIKEHKERLKIIATDNHVEHDEVLKQWIKNYKQSRAEKYEKELRLWINKCEQRLEGTVLELEILKKNDILQLPMDYNKEFKLWINENEDMLSLLSIAKYGKDEILRLPVEFDKELKLWIRKNQERLFLLAKARISKDGILEFQVNLENELKRWIEKDEERIKAKLTTGKLSLDKEIAEAMTNCSSLENGNLRGELLDVFRCSRISQDFSDSPSIFSAASAGVKDDSHGCRGDSHLLQFSSVDFVALSALARACQSCGIDDNSCLDESGSLGKKYLHCNKEQRIDHDDMDDFKACTVKMNISKRHKKNENDSHSKSTIQVPSTTQGTDKQNQQHLLSAIKETYTPVDTQQLADDMPPPPKPPRIFYTTRTHSQINQIIQELKRVKYPVNMTILASRDKTCLNPAVKNLVYGKNEECKKLVKQKNCRYYQNVAKVANVLKAPKVWDIEELVEMAKEHYACPYYVTREVLNIAQIIICPYNYLIDGLVRQAMEITIDKDIIIFDEAHNIEDACRESASFDLSLSVLQDHQERLKNMIFNAPYESLKSSLQTLRNFFEMLIAAIEYKARSLEKGIQYGRDEGTWKGEAMVDFLREAELTSEHIPKYRSCMDNINESLESFRISRKHEDLRNKKWIEKLQHNITKPLLTLDTILYVLQLCFSSEHDISSFEMAIAKDPNSTKWSIWCLNPAVSFRSISRNARSIVLTSGTLSPMTSFSSELGTEFNICGEMQHVIDIRKQVWAGVVSHGENNTVLDCSYANANSYQFQDALGSAIMSVCEKIPKGVLCFFPSYRLLNMFSQRWQSTGVLDRLEGIKNHVFIESGGKGNNFDEMISNYYESVKSKSGALLMAVCRGKVSEGIDFKDDNARGVIIVGIPYPNTRDLQLIRKKAYNDQCRTEGKHLLSASDWYALQAFRGLNQAVGRCIRHQSDYGAIVFLDSRFVRGQCINSLSKWVQRSIHPNSLDINECAMRLEDFFRDK